LADLADLALDQETIRMTSDAVIVGLLALTGALAIWHQVRMAWPHWKTYSRFGEDEDLATRVVDILAPLREGFYCSERHISSKSSLEAISLHGEVPFLRERLALLARRGILEFHHDKTQGEGPESRLYRLSRRQVR
jgi:hypothetical protein